MKIGREANWYRPYGVVVNNKAYRVNRIKFYKDDKVLVSSKSSWLVTENGRDIAEIELPIEEIKLKRKEKFDGTVFIISLGKEQYGNETMADVYIPADMLNIHFVRYQIEYHRQVTAVYEGEQGIYISAYIKSLDEELYAIREEYEAVYKEVNDSKMAITGGNIILAKIDELRKLAERYKIEQERIYNLTIDDIEI
jgi:hypothetical protein